MTETSSLSPLRQVEVVHAIPRPALPDLGIASLEF